MPLMGCSVWVTAPERQSNGAVSAGQMAGARSVVAQTATSIGTPTCWPLDQMSDSTRRVSMLLTSACARPGGSIALGLVLPPAANRVELHDAPLGEVGRRSRRGCRSGSSRAASLLAEAPLRGQRSACRRVVRNRPLAIPRSPRSPNWGPDSGPRTDRSRVPRQTRHGPPDGTARRRSTGARPPHDAGPSTGVRPPSADVDLSMSHSRGSPGVTHARLASKDGNGRCRRTFARSLTLPSGQHRAEASPPAR